VETMTFKDKEKRNEYHRAYRNKNKVAIANQTTILWSGRTREQKDKWKEKRNKGARKIYQITTRKRMMQVAGVDYIEKFECKHISRKLFPKTEMEFIKYFTFGHNPSFKIIKQIFDKEAINNHPIYSKRNVIDIPVDIWESLSDEYIRECLTVECWFCQIENKEKDRLDLEEKKQ
jgi:hypothetical protein